MLFKAITLAIRPEGHLTEDSFTLVDGELPALGPDEVCLETAYLSIDPYQRGALDARPFVGASVPIGGTIPGQGIGRVVESRSKSFSPGDLVAAPIGWQSAAVLPAALLRALPQKPYPAIWHLGVLGTPGVTAYLALNQIADPQPGETVVVSSAAGTVGSTAAQIAQARGCTVVGIAGGGAKCARLRNELGISVTIDRHDTPDLAGAVSDLLPNGVDVYFDNVGGQTLDTMLSLMNPKGRVVVCGFVSGYDTGGIAPPLENHSAISTQRLKLQGFSVRDHLDEHENARQKLRALVDQGKLRQIDSLFEGLECAPGALMALLSGKKTAGKVAVCI